MYKLVTLYGLFRTVKITCLRTTNCQICSQFDEIHDVIILENIFEKCQECMSMYINSCHSKKQIKKMVHYLEIIAIVHPQHIMGDSHRRRNVLMIGLL